ncbi:DUF2157 domain-containing protein [Alkalibacillus aidingensis]|uniref:DUF2157 domain-containing protein n=1 Tax=Alkalibacillus aidingensis TaxID=2747607 RepID=UPI0016605D92|nr:DUF2157 domain-containing protein [Alkalibacillus aidingensis]
MKRSWLEAESKEWVEEGIIDEAQQQQILSKYEKQSGGSVIFFFAAILIGLACLTFLAANWTEIHHLLRVTLIISFLVSFYVLGYWMFERGRESYGIFCNVVALAIFGTGIFLFGDMYHFSMNSVFSFTIWTIAAFLIYLSRPHIFIWIIGLVIAFAGQMISTFQLHDFNWLLLAVFVVAYGGVIYVRKHEGLSWLFASLLTVQLFAFSVSEVDYYWFTVFALLIYLLSYSVASRSVQRPLYGVAIGSMFIITIYHALLFENVTRVETFTVNDYYFLFLIPMLSLAVLFAILNKEKFGVIQLVLFVPVFIFGEYASIIACLLLFIVSISKLLEGYYCYDQQKVRFGIAGFLLSTCVVYFQMAWDFLDRSLFFLIGGIILFVIGVLLNRQHSGRLEDRRKDG